MGELIEVNPRICLKCKYHISFGAQLGGGRTYTSNVACNYICVKKHSRVFNDDPEHTRRIPAGTCDCFEAGKKVSDSGWTPEKMNMSKRKGKK